MDLTTSPVAALSPARRPRLRAFAARVDDRSRARVAVVGVSAVAAVLYLWDLTISGYANAYYAMAAQAASQSWSAWFFGSLDASNFITLDKPPLATMLMGLSVRVLGLSSLSILLPQALLGVATVALLFVVVRRSFGTAAASIAALVMALTPVAVLMFRYDNPDALLTFLLVAAGGTLLAAVESGRRRWLVATGLLVGAAFLTKYMQAYLVLPGFALAYAIAAPGSVRRRMADLVGLGLVTIAASGWWVAIVELIPAASRPYIGGSTGNSVLDLIFGYDGLARIFGMFGLDGRGPAGAGPGAVPGGLAGGGGGAGAGFGGTPGLLRMFNSEFAGEIAWLLPASAAGLGAGIWARRRAGRRDPRLAAYLAWGGWLVTTVAVFSLMSGIIHPYYTVAVAPAIAALVGAGAVEAWRMRQHIVARSALAAVLVGTAALAAVLLWETPSFLPGLGFAVVAVGAAAGLVLLLPEAAVGPMVPRAAALLALVTILAGPAAYAGATMASAHSGGTPASGPAGTGGAGGGPQPGGPGTGGFPGGSAPNGNTLPNEGVLPDGGPPSGTLPGGGLPGGPSDGGFPGGQAGTGSGTLSQAVVDYLLANRGGARWLVAVTSANEAAPIQLATGIPVMAMGGFTGSDAALSLAELQAYVASGQLRFVLAGDGRLGGGGPGGSTAGAAADTASWVASACRSVTISGSATGLYDCAGAATVDR